MIYNLFKRKPDVVEPEPNCWIQGIKWGTIKQNFTHLPRVGDVILLNDNYHRVTCVIHYLTSIRQDFPKFEIWVESVDRLTMTNLFHKNKGNL